MGNLLDELKYNIKNSAFINVILIIQFILFFWQSTMILSYFLDMPLYETSNNIQGDTAYYSLGYSYSTDEGKEAAANQSSDPDYISNQAKVYDELHANPDLHFMTFSNVAAIPVEYEMLRKRFTDQELLDFYCNSQYPGEYNPEDTPPDTLTIPSYEGKSFARYDTKICRMDMPAMKHFQLQAKDGRLLEEADFNFTWDQKVIPILVGSAYDNGFDIGDRLDADMYGTGVQLEVVGILKENTVILTDAIYTLTGEPYSLDYAIILPFFYITDLPENENQEFLADANYDEAFQEGMIAVDADTPKSEVNKIEKEINQIFVKNGLYPVSMVASTYGVKIFRTESQETLEILLGGKCPGGCAYDFRNLYEHHHQTQPEPEAVRHRDYERAVRWHDSGSILVGNPTGYRRGYDVYGMEIYGSDPVEPGVPVGDPGIGVGFRADCIGNFYPETFES